MLARQSQLLARALLVVVEETLCFTHAVKSSVLPICRPSGGSQKEEKASIDQNSEALFYYEYSLAKYQLSLLSSQQQCSSSSRLAEFCSWLLAEDSIVGQEGPEVGFGKVEAFFPEFRERRVPNLAKWQCYFTVTKFYFLLSRKHNNSGPSSAFDVAVGKERVTDGTGGSSGTYWSLQQEGP